MIPVDLSARERSVDSRESFCVSAPAGSGKTALLVRRFLGLLARVSEPERVVAITFTRKAAAEMRARVVNALRDADEAVTAQNPHEEALLAAAHAVRDHDARLGWGLLANPSRLRIQTIDSFCGYLTRQMPVLSGCGGQITATDDSRSLFREAIERFLHSELARAQDGKVMDIQTLLLHLDNDWETTVELLSGLLQRREQWQPVFGGTGLREGDRRSLLEITEALVQYRLNELHGSLQAYLGELEELMHYQAEQLGTVTAFSSDSQDIGDWRAVAGLLLTGKGEWRKAVNKTNGFPTGKAEATERKQQMLALLAALKEHKAPALLSDLKQVLLLPDVNDEPEHWDVLAALTRLLPRLAAELLLVFQQTGEVDHAQIALAALTALGSDDEPTDIALRLDHAIEHLLVDEFQDTSSVQFELIRRLTRGWQDYNVENAQAPRTLMLVGDAMQSIYGFREANVGLFIRARKEGVGDLQLTPLDLTVNFRSQQGLVEWTNTHFQAGFPSADDTQLGAVQYRSATAARASGIEPEVAVFTGEGAAEAELAALCAKLSEGVADDNVQSIAILGRSRNQLRPVLSALRERGIEAAARDLDTLAQRPLIRDLLTLSTVLCDRFDRYAWLALLRCPSIALDNSDLLLMSMMCPTAADVSDPGFSRSSDFARLSEIAQQRVTRLLVMLQWADHYRDRLALRVWVEECWLLLHGAGALRNEADIRDAERFFQCLEQLEVSQQALNGRMLTDAMDTLYASPGDERCKVQVMTLHKAKGLEFDWVFIPSLAKSTAGQDRDLLLWDEFVLPGTPPTFLLDVRANAQGSDRPRLYDYLKAQAKQKRECEATRLFYVGCTRAADYLWLGATLSWDEKKQEHRPPGAGALLSVIWPTIESQIDVSFVDPPEPAASEEATGYRRLTDLPVIDATPVESIAQGLTLADNYLARAFGTAVHRCLESLVYRENLPEACDPTLSALLRVALLDAGANSGSVNALEAQGRAMLDGVLADPWARWILSPQRQERAAELPLTTITEAGAQQLILDYSFLDENLGERWVVDYKTSAPAEGEAEAAFLADQLATYGSQLSAYAEALGKRYAQPVRCALYFPALGKHVEWSPAA